MEPLRQQRVITDAARDVGYKVLTAEQADAITAFLCGKDVLVCLLTGSGKSLFFALLPKVVDELKAAFWSKTPPSKHPLPRYSDIPKYERRQPSLFNANDGCYAIKCK